jgi:SAM-dependent methyltransferase
MSFKHYAVDIGVEASQIWWTFDTAQDHVNLCPFETTLQVFLDELPRNEPILDAGCGLARWVIFLRQRGFDVLGADYAQGALRQARTEYGDLPLLTADTTCLPLRDQSLGGIISLGVVEHTESGPVPALRELHRVVRAGGIALVSVPYNNPWRRVLINHLRRLRDWQKRRAGLKLDFDEYRFSARELRGFLETAGFEVLSMHADDFNAPFGKGLWVDSSSFFGYRVGFMDLAEGRKRWELNRRGLLLQRIANAISPWTTAAGVLAVARRR